MLEQYGSSLLDVPEERPLPALAMAADDDDNFDDERLDEDDLDEDDLDFGDEDDDLDEDDDFDDDFDDEEEDDEDDEDDASGSIRTEAAGDSASLLASAKSLRSRAEKLLAGGVAESDAVAIRASLADVAPAIEEREWRRLQVTLDTLSDLLFYLED